LAFALSFAAMLHQYRREGQVAQERAESTITLSIEQESPFWLTLGTILRGWALVEQGQGEEGITQMREGLAAYRVTGAELRWPYYLALLAGAYGKVGQAEEGLSVLPEALATVDRTGERFYEAEVYRIKGQLVLQSGVRSLESENPSTQHLAPSTQAEAEECFLKAIEIARKQQAKSLELRAVMSLVRLRQQQAAQSESHNTHHEARVRLDEAHQILSELYQWFTEGFDTKDLQDAKMLLDELSH
jgi:predicted ATPase